jgi:DNA polymerase III sliding clamp (beta) subunit (PCNA family)
MKSVWQETLDEHKARIAEMRKLAATFPEGSVEQEMLGGAYDPHHHDLQKARKCMEFSANWQYGTPTRLRTHQDFDKAGIPCDTSDFFQDARLELMIRFDAEAQQFVPMTIDEMKSEYMDALHRHAKEEMQHQYAQANNDAAGYVENWAKFRPCNQDGPMLYRVGPYDDFYTDNGKSHRFRYGADHWGTDKARLLLHPRTEAVQIEENKPQVKVTLYDGETEIMSWVDYDAPHRYEEKRGYYGASVSLSTSRDEISIQAYRPERVPDQIVFVPCPADIYVAHLEAVGGKPPAVENPICAFTADAAEFVSALKHGLAAASTDLTRPALCTVALYLEQDKCRVVSTDTYRLLLQEVACTFAAGILPEELQKDDAAILLPLKFAAFVAHSLKKPTGQATVRIGKDGRDYMVEITADSAGTDGKPAYFLTRCEEGPYVNYRKVIPCSCERQVTLNASETAKALQELREVARFDANRVVWDIDRDGIFFTAHNAEAGQAVAVAEHLGVDGDGERFACNFQFAHDYLKWQKEPVHLRLNGPLNSIAFVNCTSQYVLMPMQIM